NLACDASGNGEAEASLGTVALTTGASGNGTALALFPLADATPAASFTATATRGSSTSELSPCATPGALPDALFADGFESAGSRSALAAAGAPRATARRAAPGRVVIELVLPPAPDGAP